TKSEEIGDSRSTQPNVNPITLDAVPTLVSPSNGATITDSTPYMNWNGGDTYKDFIIEIDNNADFSSPEVDAHTGMNTYYTVTTSLASGTYYWHVREQDYFSNIWGGWTGTWSFTLELSPTVAPTLITPTDEDYINDDTPYLDWSTVPLATSYQYQIATTTLFFLPTVNINVGGSSATSPHLNDRHYYWRVRGYNSEGYGPWSSVWGFTVDTVSPGSLTLVSPANYLVTSDYTPTFVWNSASGAWRYRLEVDNTADFSSPGIIVHTSGLSYTSGLNLLNGQYFWRVRAYDQADNNGPWSATWRVTINKPVPPAPILVSPASGTYTKDNTPFLDWNAASLAVAYQVQIATTPTFSSTERDITTSSTAYIPSALPDGAHYWRVRGRDSIGNWGPWSTVWVFIIDTVPPGTTILVSPASWSYTNDNTPTFDWNPATGGYNYQIQISRDLFFSLIFLQSTSTNTIYTPSTVFTDGDYWWRVRAIDRAGNEGPWSAIWLISVDTVPPGTPTPLTPADDAYSNDTTLYLEWTASVGGYSYQLHVDTDAGFGSLDVDYTSENTNYTTSSLSDGVYYWRVRSIDQAGNIGGWSEVWQFTIDTIAPEQIPLNLPGNGVTINDPTPQLQWYELGDAVEYQILVDTVDVFSSPIINELTSATFLNIVTVLADGDYYWKVRAKDASGNWGLWSAIWAFTIDATGPDQPILSSPANDTIISDNTPQMFVGIVATATTYQFQIATTDAFGTLIINVEVASNAYTLISALTDGTYYWRVRAADSLDNWSEWSETWVFTIDATAPDQPILSSPANGTLSNDNLPQLVAGIVSTAVTYQFQIATSDSFDTLILDIIVPTNYYDVVSALIDGKYYWRVRAADSLDNWSEWSETWIITIDTTAPDQPILSNPANSTLTSVTEPQLVVEVVLTAVTYHFQIATSDSFDTLILNIEVPENYYDVVSALIDGKYYWRVRAADNLDNWSEWSETWVLTIDTTNPTINQPEDIAYDFGSLDNNITWTPTDLHPNTYAIYLNGTELVSDDWTTGDEITISIDGLSVGAYNYTIVVTDLAGNSLTNTVIVTVLATIQEFSPITGLMIIGLCGAIASLTIKQKFKKKK
ncbi:MAG: hypothetical protein ACTSVO_12240, partial [Candidatus Heimdallarchaeaceae archaeon]